MLRVLSAIVEEISYENRFRVVELGMLLGFDWKMKLGFGGFSDSDLKMRMVEEERKCETIRG